jgi:CRP-like cAMP-binding protein
LNIGQRGSLQRISHFLCEISFRLRVHGQIEGGAPIELPLSQAVLADTTGVSKVHINRILQQLRRDGIVELRRNQLTILDPVRLAQLTDFDEGYLLEEHRTS